MQWRRKFRIREEAERMRDLFGGSIFHRPAEAHLTGVDYWEWALYGREEMGVVVSLISPYVTRVRVAVWEASLGKA